MSTKSINEVKPGEIGVFQTMIASGPVIIRDNREIDDEVVEEVLLVKHGDKPLDQLKWKFPGGKILAGLSLDENAVREAKEEVGVNVRLIRSLCPIILWNEIPESGSFNPQAILLIHYLARISEEPVAGPEILAMEWFNIRNLPNGCAPNVQPVIDDYLETC